MRVFNQHKSTYCEQFTRNQPRKDRVDIYFSVGRVKENEVKSDTFGQIRQRGRHGPEVQLMPIGKTAIPGVGANHLASLPILLERNDGSRTTRERLDAQSTRARKEIQHPSPANCAPVLQYAKGRLTQARTARTNREASGHGETPAARLTGDHTHGSNLPGRTLRGLASGNTTRKEFRGMK